MLWWAKRRRLRLWQKAMSLCNMDEETMSGFWAWRAQLTARSGSIEVRITDASGGGDGVVVVVEGPEGFSDLKLSRHLDKLWRREIEIGDEAFDKAYFIRGQLPSVAARLDAAVRGELLCASAYGTSPEISTFGTPLEIGDGRLRVEVSEKALPRILPTLVSIGRRFAEPLDVKSRLLHHARRDPKPEVRLLNLLVLIREHPGDPDTLEVLRGACTDPSLKVRVRAAVELGEEGHDILQKIAEKSSDYASSDLAVSHLGGKLSVAAVKDILSRALRKRAHQTARACLESLGRRGAAAVGILARVMTKQKGELAIAAAVALGTTGERAAEAALLEALQSEDSGLREAAATALGRVGTAAAVQPLQEAAERSWLALGLRSAARQAIAEIQSRLQGASPGQLSLAGTEAGQLSLAQADAGQLSLAHAEVPLHPHATAEPEQPSRNTREKGVEPV